MDDYDCIKTSSLKLKGEKRKKKSKPSSAAKKSSKQDDNSQTSLGDNKDERKEDADDHGGWWKVDQYEHIKDYVAIEFIPGCYAKALTNGSIVLGNPHPPGEEPDEEEIFTAISTSTNQIALKSGFGRYLSIDSRKCLVGLSEAIGEAESFLPVFENGKTALCAYNDCFLAPDEEDESQPIMAKSKTVGTYEILNIRINNCPYMYTR